MGRMGLCEGAHRRLSDRLEIARLEPVWKACHVTGGRYLPHLFSFAMADGIC